MRAALLTPYYWPEVRRGTERLVHDLADGLDGQGWNATVLHGKPGPGSSITGGNGSFEIVGIPRRQARLARALGYAEDVGHLPGMRRELRRADCDIAHAFGLFEAAIATRDGSPLVFTVTGIPQRANVEGLFWRRRALARVAGRAGAIVAISEAARRQIEWMGGHQRVIYPGVDLDAFRKTRERAEQPTILCTASSADPRKRVPLVIEAFRELRKRVADARLILSTRPGEDVSVSPGEPGIEMRLLDGHTELVDAYSEAWVTVIASTSEAFGLVAVESLACGTPVVATADAGLVEAVGGAGPHSVLFEESSAVAVARTLEKGLNLDVDADACRRQASRFSVERSTEAHVALYEELLA